jgi:hypothetical protein
VAGKVDADEVIREWERRPTRDQQRVEKRRNRDKIGQIRELHDDEDVFGHHESTNEMWYIDHQRSQRYLPENQRNNFIRQKNKSSDR